MSKNRLGDDAVNFILSRFSIASLRQEEDEEEQRQGHMKGKIPSSINSSSRYHDGSLNQQHAHKSKPHMDSKRHLGLQSFICQENRLTEVPRYLHNQALTLRELQVLLFSITYFKYLLLSRIYFPGVLYILHYIYA